MQEALQTENSAEARLGQAFGGLGIQHAVRVTASCGGAGRPSEFLNGFPTEGGFSPNGESRFSVTRTQKGASYAPSFPNQSKHSANGPRCGCLGSPGYGPLTLLLHVRVATRAAEQRPFGPGRQAAGA